MTISRRLQVVLLAIIAFGFPSPSRAEDAPKLSKEQGPFLVLAYSFRGDNAETQANELVKELKKDHNLDAFTYEAPERKGVSFQVFVGDCKTTKESFELKNRIKKIDLKSIPARKGQGLSRAMVLKNPMAEAK
jgi:hypothetical protein